MKNEPFTFEFLLAKFRAIQRSLDHATEVIDNIDRKVAYVEKIVRDHEKDDWCEHEDVGL